MSSNPRLMKKTKTSNADCLQRRVRPQTFGEIHKIIKPASEMSVWSPAEKRAVTKFVKAGQLETDVLLRAMDLEPNDWTPNRKREIRALMWPNVES
jgi:hypothetical protein